MPEEDAPVATTAENAYHNGRSRRVSQYNGLPKAAREKVLDLLEELVDLNLRIYGFVSPVAPRSTSKSF